MLSDTFDSYFDINLQERRCFMLSDTFIVYVGVGESIEVYGGGWWQH